MPVEAHKFLPPPADATLRAWRYMDLAKFVSLISRSELYFCNLEILAKDDPYEGLLSTPNYRHRQWHSIADLTPDESEALFFRPMNDDERRIQFESTRNAKEYWLRRRFYDRRTLSINCWHQNRFESAAMWAQYVPGGQGIALTSSYERIIKALDATPERAFIGEVQYLDFDSDPVDNSTILPFQKRRSFVHENELRIAHWDLDVQNQVNDLCTRLTAHTMDHLYRRISTPINWDLIKDDVEKVPFVPGKYLAVDIDTLVEDVYVSPASPNWFLEVIKSVLGKYSLRRSPRRSDILSSPMR